MSSNTAELKKQLEYYLSDKNLANDKFFHDKLSETKEVCHSLFQYCLGLDGNIPRNELQQDQDHEGQGRRFRRSS